MNLYSYIVRYDSGFAPNPFYGYCTLATCKPDIRKGANVGDWIVGCGSADRQINQGGKLVYAMEITEHLCFEEYFRDDRFQSKKPNLNGSKKQQRGDNIYSKVNNSWRQLNSYHSNEDGSPHIEHINRDTRVNRVLISDKYVYFGANGPDIPTHMISNEKKLCHEGIGESKFSTPKDEIMIKKFKEWFYSLNQSGYVNHPFDWN